MVGPVWFGRRRDCRLRRDRVYHRLSAKTRQIEIEAWLKQDMLNRGLSPEQIKTVLEARSDGEARRLCASQGVRVGLGNFQVKVGSMDESASHAAHR